MKNIHIILLLLTSSCLSINDTYTELGKEYTLICDGKWESIHSNGYYHTEIYSKVTDYSFDKRYIIAKQEPDYEYYKLFVRADFGSRFRIYCNYLKDSTSQFFMEDTTSFGRQAKREDRSLYRLLKSKGVTIQNMPEDWDKIDPVVDSIFKNDPFYIKVFSLKENFWIIDKDNNIRFGPLSFNEFKKLRAEKNIKLKFKDE